MQADLALVSAVNGGDQGSSSSSGGGHLRLGSSIGVWHSLTLSFSQQLIGPLRMCADLRLALNSPLHSPRIDGVSRGWTTSAATSTPGGAGDQVEVPNDKVRSGSAVLRDAKQRLSHAASAVATTVRPSLLDATYALDLAVPGASGLARVVAWYSPFRKEGMVELRMF